MNSTGNVNRHSVQRLVSRWRKEARRMKQNAAHWGNDKKADKMRKELAIEWSIGLAQAFTQCADELEAANSLNRRNPVSPAPNNNP